MYATHGHNDHIGCISALLESLGDVPVYMHIGDRSMIRSQIEERAKKGKEVDSHGSGNNQLALHLLTNNEAIHVGERVVVLHPSIQSRASASTPPGTPRVAAVSSSTRYFSRETPSSAEASAERTSKAGSVHREGTSYVVRTSCSCH